MEGNTVEEIIARLDILKTELDTYRPIPADRMNRIMQKLRLEWNFNSNSMEGNTLTKQETKKLLHYGLTAKGKPMRDHIEMQGHDKALKKLEGIVHKDLKLSESLIKDFHKMILAESVSLAEENVEINPGEWKKHYNYLLSPTGERIDFAPPDQVSDLMSKLISWTNNHLYQAELNRHKKKKYDLHPVIIAAIFHKRFIAIHPFGDGNGRMGRILMNLLLMQNGFMPTIVPLTSRDGYYLALNDSTAEDMSPLVEYVGQNLIQSMELAIKGAKGDSVEEPKDWEKELEVMRQSVTSENTKIEQTTWSFSNQERVIKKVVFPLLEALEPNFKSLQGALFEEGYWTVFENLIGTKQSTTKEVDVVKNFVLNQYVEKKKPRITINYAFEGFKAKGKNFDTIFVLELSCEKEFYTVGITIGNEEVRDRFIKAFSSLLAYSLKEDKNYINLEMVSKSPYNKLFNPAQINAYSDVIMKNLMTYIKKQKGE
jgi:Fic family protein